MMHELILSSVAGASSGIEWATEHRPDIAINHDAEVNVVNHCDRQGWKTLGHDEAVACHIAEYRRRPGRVAV